MMQSSRRRKATPTKSEGATNGGAMDLPQGFTDEVEGSPTGGKVKVELPQTSIKNLRSRRRFKSDGNLPKDFLIRFGILMTITVVASFFLVSKHEQRRMTSLRQEIQHDQLDPLSKEWEEKYAILVEENEKLKQEAEQLETLRKEKDEAMQYSGELDQKVARLASYKDEMHQAIQSMSKRALLEKFGPGPHYVEMNLAFEVPEEAEMTESEAQIILEVAPEDDMPYAAYWFLEQVSRKLFDGFSFMRNPGWVIQAGPYPNFRSEETENDKRQRLLDAGFNTLLFQEYSPRFPHEELTLGYAGRPGGPDFYISTQNNTINHGPGGDGQYHDVIVQADTCFAKIIEGQDVVEKMKLVPLKTEGWKELEHSIAITSMKIIPKDGEENDNEAAPDVAMDRIEAALRENEPVRDVTEKNDAVENEVDSLQEILKEEPVHDAIENNDAVEHDIVSPSDKEEEALEVGDEKHEEAKKTVTETKKVKMTVAETIPPAKKDAMKETKKQPLDADKTKVDSKVYGREDMKDLMDAYKKRNAKKVTVKGDTKVNT